MTEHGPDKDPYINRNKSYDNPTGMPEKVTYVPERKDTINTVKPNPDTPTKSEVSGMKEYGGYTNIRSVHPNTLYQPGMPIPLDSVENPRPGDPQVGKPF